MNVFGQRNALIVIVKDDEVQVLTWTKGVLNHNAVFAATEHSFDVFGRFLDNHRDFPVIIVADVIEESFRYDSIAHVSSNDRKVILNRKLEYLFRDTVYRTAEVVEREATGRRDDKVLLSALTKPEQLEPWVKLVIERDMAIQAITSAAYVIEQYAASQGLGKSENLLIVSLESGSSFRQTYVQKGKVMFSRVSRLEIAEGQAPGPAIRNETLQVRKYLERARLLRMNSQLRFHVLSPFEQSEIETAFRATDSFECLSTEEEARQSPLELHGNNLSTLIVILAKILSSKRLANIYAPLETRRYHVLRRVSQGLIAASAAVLAGVIILKTPGFTGVLSDWERTEQVVANTVPYTNEYQRLSQDFPETPIPPSEMELVVTSAQKIQQNSIEPLDTMNTIGAALAQSPDLQITSIAWSLREAPSPDAVRRDPYGPAQNQSAESSFRRAIFEDRLTPTITIQGMAYSPRSYREAQMQVDSFVQALRNQDSVAQVVTTKLPTNVSSDTSVNTTVDDSELRASFTLEITLKKEST